MMWWISKNLARVAPRHPTTTVTVHHDSPGAVGHDVLAPPDRDRDAVVDEHRGQQPVTGDVLADRVRQEVPGRIAEPAVDVEMHVDPEPIAPLR